MLTAFKKLRKLGQQLTWKLCNFKGLNVLDDSDDALEMLKTTSLIHTWREKEAPEES